MKPRDRVLMALDHEEPDRCPMQISFTPEFAERLRADINDSTVESHNPHGGGNTYTLERALGEDLLLTSVGWANSYYQTKGSYTDEWGIGWRSVEYQTPFGRGSYTEIIDHPLADEDAISSYLPPDPSRPELYLEAERVIREFGEEYCIVGVTVTTIFECAWGLRGLERMLSDLALRPDLANAILDIPYRYHLEAAKRLTQMGVDIIWLGDDVGAQNTMLISPMMWRTYLKPRMANLIEEIKSINPNVKVAYHSDGVIYPIIPELIEIGIDILNPIQPACMEPAVVKNRFGNQLCFWGSVDEQWTLPFGKSEDVRNEILSRIRTIGKGGGLILGPTHHVQLDTPIENFWAMVHAITETPYGSVSLRKPIETSMKNQQRVTIKDVARGAGVSVQTVSRVINNRPDVAPETRQRIQQVIENLDYQPSALARSLIQQRSFTLGVVIAGLKYIGPSRTLNGITQRAEELGYSLLLKELPSFTTGEIQPLIQSLIARHVDGIIWATSEVGENQSWVSESMTDLTVPILFITSHPRDGVYSVAYDNKWGGQMATQHLFLQGYEHIGHISGPLDWWEARERKLGWEQALREAGKEPADNQWQEGNWSSASGESAFQKLLATYPGMDAVFVGNDQMALGLLQVARRKGLQVPHELGLIGFDGIPESRYYWPPLSTIMQDQNLLGCLAVEKIVAIIECMRLEEVPPEPKADVLLPELIIRESSVEKAA